MCNDSGSRGTSLLQRVKRRVSEELSVPPRTAKERFRHELKYLISYAQKADLNVRMAPLLGLDKHASNGGYMIRSLYFDDYWNTAYQGKSRRCAAAQEIPYSHLRLQRPRDQTGTQTQKRQLDL